MVLSCLVEPLVSPLIGGTSGPRRSGLAGSRLAATAIACTALAALSGVNLPEAMQGKAAKAPQAIAKKSESQVAARNAHQKPAPIPYRQLLQTVFFVAPSFVAPKGAPELAAPGEAPRFEQTWLEGHRLRHKRDIIRETGPCLGLAQRIDRLTGGLLQTFLRFGSGVHLSGQPVV